MFTRFLILEQLVVELERRVSAHEIESVIRVGWW